MSGHRFANHVETYAISQPSSSDADEDEDEDQPSEIPFRAITTTALGVSGKEDTGFRILQFNNHSIQFEFKSLNDEIPTQIKITPD